MGNPENTEWHYRHNIEVDRLAFEMSRLFVLGHAAVQCTAYTEAQDRYLQALTDGVWHDYAAAPLIKDRRVSG